MGTPRTHGISGMARFAGKNGRLLSGVAIAVVLPLCLTACPGGTGGAFLQVTPTALNFGTEATTDSFVVANAGSGQLTWNLSGLPAWLSASQAGGTVGAGSDVVTLTVDRLQLAEGVTQGSFMVLSNGGDREVAVSVQQPVPAVLAVSPDVLDFGIESISETLTLSNTGGASLAWNIAIDPASEWTPVLSSNQGNLGAGESAGVTVTGNRAPLAPGSYTATLLVSGAGSQVTVTATITKPAPGELFGELSVSDTLITYAPQQVERTLTVDNVGDGDMTWHVGPPSTAWLTVVPQDLQLDLAPDASPVPVTMTVDPNNAALALPGVYDATFDIRHLRDGNTIETVTVTVRYEVRAAELAVTPNVVDFGIRSEVKFVNLVNLGAGTLQWSFDAINLGGSLPNTDWLTVERNDGAGNWLPLLVDPGTQYLLDGSTLLRISIDRSQAPPPADENQVFEAALVFSDDGGSQPELNISFLVPPDVDMEVDAGDEDILTVDVDQFFLPLQRPEIGHKSFTISHTGTTGELVWSIDTTGLPAWLEQVDPASGELMPGESETVKIYVDVFGLVPTTEPEPHVLTVASNDTDQPNGYEVTVNVDILSRGEIAVSPADLVVPSFVSVSAMSVANSAWLHSPFSTLNFQIDVAASDQAPLDSPHPSEWLFVDPKTGSSVAVQPPGLDWKDSSVAIDRYALQGLRGRAQIIVDNVPKPAAPGEDVPESSERPIRDEALDDMILRYVLEVEVEIQDLTLEGPGALVRTPSQLRAPMILRNRREETLPRTPADFGPQGTGTFSIFEEDQPIEGAETTQFVTSAAHMRAEVVILLDFSRSMVESLGGIDALKRAYMETVEELLSEVPGDSENVIPPNFRFAVMEFHDRVQNARLLQWFTDYRAVNQPSALLGRNVTVHSKAIEDAVIDEPGATVLLPAVEEAQNLLNEAETVYSPIDQAELRAIVCISDGRLTTPPGEASSLSNQLFEDRIVFYSVGWGSEINGSALATLSADTLGHFYAAVGEDVDPTLLVNPNYTYPMPYAIGQDTAEFLAREGTGPPPGKIQLLRQDLARYVVLNYITLREESGVNMFVRAALAGEDVNGPGEEPNPPANVVGSIETRRYDTVLAAGDVRLGQIALRTQGILPTTENPLAPAEDVEVYVRADYVPRGCDRILLTLTAPHNFTWEVAPNGEGGLIEGWQVTEIVSGGNTYTLELQGAEALQYGAYGDLLRLTFAEEDTGPDFQVLLDVDNSIYWADLPAGLIGFNHAAALDVTNFGWSHAPAFPFLAVAPQVFDFERVRERFQVTVVGGGGDGISWSVVSAPAWLNFEDIEGAAIVGFPNESNTDGANFQAVVDRAAAGAGQSDGVILIEYESNALEMQGVLLVAVSVLNPS